MKRFLSAFLVAVLTVGFVFLLTACDKTKTETYTPEKSEIQAIIRNTTEDTSFSNTITERHPDGDGFYTVSKTVTITPVSDNSGSGNAVYIVKTTERNGVKTVEYTYATNGFDGIYCYAKYVDGTLDDSSVVAAYEYDTTYDENTMAYSRVIAASDNAAGVRVIEDTLNIFDYELGATAHKKKDALIKTEYTVKSADSLGTDGQLNFVAENGKVTTINFLVGDNSATGYVSGYSNTTLYTYDVDNLAVIYPDMWIDYLAEHVK